MSQKHNHYTLIWKMHYNTDHLYLTNNTHMQSYTSSTS